MFAPLAGAALAEWQSVGFVFALAGGALAALGLVVLALRPPRSGWEYPSRRRGRMQCPMAGAAGVRPNRPK